MALTGGGGCRQKLRGESNLIEPPKTFDSFWSELRAEVDSVDCDWDRTERSQIVTSRGHSWKIDWIRYSSVEDHLIQGWLAVPYDHQANGAGFLWMPGYSYGTPRPDDSDLVEGTVTCAINVHGNTPDEAYVNPAGKNDYILNGIDDPRTYIYRVIVAHCLCAVGVLLNQPEISGGIASAGMSQGGGLALIVSSQSALTGICCADMPFLADLRTALTLSHSPAYRTLKRYIDEHPKCLDTVLLFDSLFHAGNIHVPTWLSAGGKDPACKPVTVEAVYAQLASKNKHYEYFPNAGHIFMPQMNAAYREMVDDYLV
jgi:cephalosporin-C deacetylase-like acetyl esterase